MGPIDQIMNDLEIKVTKGQRVKIESFSRITVFKIIVESRQKGKI